MDTALPQKFPFILDRNLAKANCTGNHVCTSCDTVVLDLIFFFFFCRIGAPVGDAPKGLGELTLHHRRFEPRHHHRQGARGPHLRLHREKHGQEEAKLPRGVV